MLPAFAARGGGRVSHNGPRSTGVTLKQGEERTMVLRCAPHRVLQFIGREVDDYEKGVDDYQKGISLEKLYF